jgi:predicted small integral membrane protein
MLELRLAKIVMIGSLTLFAFIVTFDNITDYNSNFVFVQHVLSMDTTFPGNALMYRAITTPALWHLAYAFIIAAEGLTCLMLAIATVQLLCNVRAPAHRFNQSKRFAFVGIALGFLIWFFGFMVVGGEWFAMWQSSQWNGQAAAFRFYAALLGVAIFVNQHDSEINGRTLDGQA